MQNERHMKGGSEDSAGKAPECKEETRNAVKFDTYREKLIRMNAKFEFMRKRHLGHRHAAKHCIKLTSKETQPVYCVPYRVGPRGSEVETEKDKMLETGVTVPAEP